jgi:hypothetical protein
MGRRTNNLPLLSVIYRGHGYRGDHHHLTESPSHVRFAFSCSVFPCRRRGDISHLWIACHPCDYDHGHGYVYAYPTRVGPDVHVDYRVSGYLCPDTALPLYRSRVESKSYALVDFVQANMISLPRSLLDLSNLYLAYETLPVEWIIEGVMHIDSSRPFLDFRLFPPCWIYIQI